MIQEGRREGFEFRQSRSGLVHSSNLAFGELVGQNFPDPMGLLDQTVEVSAYKTPRATFTFVRFPGVALAGTDLINLLGNARPRFPFNYNATFLSRNPILVDWDIINRTDEESRRVVRIHERRYKPFWPELRRYELPGLITVLKSPGIDESEDFLTRWGHEGLRVTPSKREDLSAMQIDINATQPSVKEGHIVTFGEARGDYTVYNFGNGRVRLGYQNSWADFQYRVDTFEETAREIETADGAKKPVIGFVRPKGSIRRIFLGPAALRRSRVSLNPNESPILGLIASVYISGHKDDFPAVIQGRQMTEAQLPLLHSMYRSTIIEWEMYQRIEDYTSLSV